MKLLPINTQKRVDTQDSLGHGMDAVIMLAIFLLAGFGLDRLFGTMPVFMIVMTVIGSIGLFYKFKYRYNERMEELEELRRGPAERNAAAQADAASSSAAPTDPEAAA